MEEIKLGKLFEGVKLVTCAGERKNGELICFINQKTQKTDKAIVHHFVAEDPSVVSREYREKSYSHPKELNIKDSIQFSYPKGNGKCEITQPIPTPLSGRYLKGNKILHCWKAK